MSSRVALRYGDVRRKVVVALLAVLLGAAAIGCCLASSSGPSSLALTGPQARPNAHDDGWFAFDPAPDPFAAGTAFDLRGLNEAFAGENGFIEVKGGEFVHAGNGRPERFWGVNGPPRGLAGAALRKCARLLAKRGVNLVRIHRGYFDETGEVNPAEIRETLQIVEVLKAEGIYTYLSIYYPLWFAPKPGTPWLEGYDGKKHPFAALEFNAAFQARYRAWWKALLTTPSPTTGRRLVDEPAVAGVEIQNEDSFFFWTFSSDAVPDAQFRILERMFGAWLVNRFGSIDAALARWDAASGDRGAGWPSGVRRAWRSLRSLVAKWTSTRVKRDDAPEEGRVAIRPLWDIIHERTLRDQDTVRFLLEAQTRFYSETYAFLRELGFKGVITASNWTTASGAILEPIEKLSYAPGDFIDRHGYFGANHHGPEAEWSLREGHTYSDRSALRFDGEDPGEAREFSNPALDPHYDGKPSMLSETAWNRPNRFRSEAPLFLAVYGALQHSDAIVYFALDGDRWSVRPRQFMQPWTVMSPAVMGQFPAAALIFRRALVPPGAVLAEIALDPEALLRLEGTPLARLDPLIHLAGRVEVEFTHAAASTKVRDLAPFVDRAARNVRSTNGELKLDYRIGLLTIDAPGAQGVSGRLREAGAVETRDLLIASPMEVGHVVAVALDDRPLRTASRILLQVMSEERPTGFRAERVSPTVQRIVSLGRDPWRVKEFAGTLRLKRADATQLKVTALDFNGYPVGSVGTAGSITLRPSTTYYLIGR
jgi:hypothetical protein